MTWLPTWARAVLAFALLNALLTFENRWPGWGVHAMPRLSFELCLALLALMGWVAWHGALSRRASRVLALGFVFLVLVRYASVTAPALLGRPVNVYWDGQHAWELLRVVAASVSAWSLVAALLLLFAGLWALVWLARRAWIELAAGVAAPRARPWLVALVAGLGLSFLAYVPGQRDTRWFFSLPLTPTLLHQGELLARVWLTDRADGLGESPAFQGDLSGLIGPRGPADVLLVFAESYGMVSFDRPEQAAALAQARATLEQAIHGSGRHVVSARVVAPTFGGASWLSHAALLAGVDTRDPADHDLLLTSERPTLVHHFARHGYRTVGWMPGIKRPWPEGSFYGFQRLADDRGIGYEGMDFGYWRIPDQAAMALLRAQELAPTDRAPRFVVFPTTSTHAPFHPLAPLVADAARPDAYSAADVASALAAPLAVRDPLGPYLDSLRYQLAWLAQEMQRSPAAEVWVIVGDHQPPGLVSGSDAPWEVPVHVISDNRLLLQRLLGSGFVPGLQAPAQALGPMHHLTRVLLQAFDAPSADESQGTEHVDHRRSHIGS